MKKDNNILKNKQIISALKHDLSASFNDFIGIYFYGSRLKGDYEADSDFDLIFIFKNISSFLLHIFLKRIRNLYENN